MTYLTLSQAAKRLPNRPHAGSVWRWCRKGVRSRSGRRIHLDHVRIGGRIYVTDEAIDQFGRELAQADQEHVVCDESTRRAARSDGPPTRKSQAEKAKDELDEAGI